MSTRKKQYPEIWTYIVAAGSSADELTCGVPLKVNNDYIFFGPCMKRYREDLYKTYLKNEKIGKKEIDKDIYFLGMSGSKVKNAKKDEIRKILWFGKLVAMFTFEHMHYYIDSLQNKELKSDFEKIKNLADSPLHIQPIFENNLLIGYELRSSYHFGKWFNDIASDKSKLRISNKKKVILKNPDEHHEVFDRDCCLLFENIFYAEGKGLEIDSEILTIFKEHPHLSQRAHTITSRYYIYGKIEGSNRAIGLEGRGLKFTGTLGKKLFECMLKKISSIEKTTHSSVEIRKLDICKS